MAAKKRTQPRRRRPKDATAGKIEWWPIDRLHPDERNAKIHGPDQVQMLRASVREFGQVWPILVRQDGTIVAHHGFWEACRDEGYEEIKVLLADNMTPDQIRAYVIADNALAAKSGWNPELLQLEIQELEANAKLPPLLLGFTGDDVQRILDDADEQRMRSLAAAGATLREGVTVERTPDGMERLTVPLTPDGLTVVREALKAAKAAHEVKTAGEALTMICSDWMNAKEA